MKKIILLLILLACLDKTSFAQTKSNTEITAYFIYGAMIPARSVSCASTITGNYFGPYNCLKLYDMVVDSKSSINAIVRNCEIFMQKVKFNDYANLPPEQKKYIEVVKEEQEYKEMVEGKVMSEKFKSYIQVQVTIKGNDAKAITDMIQALTLGSATGSVKFAKPESAQPTIKTP